MVERSYTWRDDEGWSEPSEYGSPVVPKGPLRPEGYQPYRRMAPYDPAHPPGTYPEPEYVPKYHELLPPAPPPPPPRPPLYKSLFTVLPPTADLSASGAIPAALTESGLSSSPYPPTSPVPARDVRRRIGIVAAAVVVLLVAAGSVLLATRDSHSPGPGTGPASTAGRRFVLPTGFDRYAVLDTDLAHQLEAQLTSSTPEAIAEGSAVAVYGLADSTRPELGLIGISAATAEDFAAQLRRAGPAALLTSFLLDTGVVLSEPRPAGNLGGQLRCGTRLAASGSRLPTCAWADESMLVAVVFYQTPRDLPENLTLKLRDRAER